MFKYIFLLTISLSNLFFAYAAEDEQYKIKTVVIDAGHGGKDPGAIGKHSKEKDITLSIAKMLGHYIETLLDGVKVIYTRDDDTFIELHKRAEIANKNHADLFISIHVNASTNRKATGTDSWVMGLHKSEKNLEVAKLENQVILIEDDYSSKYQGVDPNSSESYIIFNLMQNVFNEQSMEFASLVQDQFEKRVGRKNRGVKSAPFFVLWNTTMPSILIETGFITNETEEKFLRTKQGQDFIASAIFRAFRDYKNTIEEHSNFPKKEERPPIEFSLQLISSSSKIDLNPDNFKGIEGVFETETDGTYKYALGREPNYESIIKLKESIKEKYPDAFVIAYRDGIKIPVSEALENLEKE